MSDWIIDWMTGQGRPGYATRIKALQAKLATATEAEREQLEREINDVKQEAQDRYDDWKTDPLP